MPQVRNHHSKVPFSSNGLVRVVNSILGNTWRFEGRSWEGRGLVRGKTSLVYNAIGSTSFSRDEMISVARG